MGGKSTKENNAKIEGDLGGPGESSCERFPQKIGSSFPKKKEYVSTKVYKTVGKSVADFVKSDNGKCKISPGEGNKRT